MMGPESLDVLGQAPVTDVCADVSGWVTTVLSDIPHSSSILGAPRGICHTAGTLDVFERMPDRQMGWDDRASHRILTVTSLGEANCSGALGAREVGWLGWPRLPWAWPTS